MSRVVLVEDNDDLHTVYAWMLRLGGHTTNAFSTAELASTHFDNAEADVAFLDLKLAGRAGR